LFQQRQQVPHRPIADEFLVRLHGTDPIAKQRHGLFIHRCDHERRHLSSTAPRESLIKNRAIRVAGRDQHGIADPEGVVLWPGAKDIHLFALGGETQLHP